MDEYIKSAEDCLIIQLQKKIVDLQNCMNVYKNKARDLQKQAMELTSRFQHRKKAPPPFKVSTCTITNTITY